jgi:serpin B
VIEFPYADSGFVLMVILPDVGGFEDFEAELNAGTLDAAISQLTDTDVLVYLPKFEFEFGTSLKETLPAMGMTDAFSQHADFSGMLDGPPPETDSRCMVDGSPPTSLAVGNVLHKAFVVVDERGTEAAAATVVLGSPTGMGVRKEPIEVRIDRPFIFAIRDTRTGTVLFLGRMMAPRM